MQRLELHTGKQKETSLSSQTGLHHMEESKEILTNHPIQNQVQVDQRP